MYTLPQIESNSSLFEEERERFFQWLRETAEANASVNQDLSEKEILALIDQARTEVSEEEWN